MDSQRYTVKIVFRGLCLVQKKADQGLDFFLPDASIVPQPRAVDAENDARARLLRKVRPFREHHAVLEFPRADWENKSAITPRLLQINKPTKEPVALYLLRKQQIHFSGLYMGDTADPQPPERLVADEERYTRLGNLLLLGNDDEYGFDQLPGFLGEVADDALENSAAVTSLSVGEALTERRSRRRQLDLVWREVRPLHEDEELPPVRLLNLDIAVRFTLPVWNPLRITCDPLKERFPGDERTFLLRPNDPSRGVTVWIKNRELSAILLDSDALPDPYEPDCPHRGDLDRDHAMLALLAKHPENMTIPQRVSGDASDCGSGCGCSDTRP
jgi:hypothetical protein